MAAWSAYDVAEKLKGIPIWCFHNGGDPIVSAGSSAEMCRLIPESGGNVRYAQFSAFGHDCWERAYEQSDLGKWMLEQRRGEAQATLEVDQ